MVPPVGHTGTGAIVVAAVTGAAAGTAIAALTTARRRGAATEPAGADGTAGTGARGVTTTGGTDWLKFMPGVWLGRPSDAPTMPAPSTAPTAAITAPVSTLRISGPPGSGRSPREVIVTAAPSL